MAVDQVVERTMMLVNRALGTMPFGAGLALQLTMKALTIKTVAQSLANLDVNEHLFTIMGVAESYVREAYRIAGQDPLGSPVSPLPHWLPFWLPRWLPF